MCRQLFLDFAFSRFWDFDFDPRRPDFRNFTFPHKTNVKPSKTTFWRPLFRPFSSFRPGPVTFFASPEIATFAPFLEAPYAPPSFVYVTPAKPYKNQLKLAFSPPGAPDLDLVMTATLDMGKEFKAFSTSPPWTPVSCSAPSRPQILIWTKILKLF